MQLKYGRVPVTTHEEVSKSGAARYNNLFIDNADNFILKRKDKFGNVFTVIAQSSTQEVYTCGQAIAGSRAVALIDGLLWHFQPSNPAHTGLCIGVSTQAGAENTSIEINIKGRLNNVGDFLIPNIPVYSGDNGTLIQEEPTTGLLQSIGLAIDAATLFVDISPCFILE